MDIEEIRQKRVELENEICTLISNFEEETDAEVKEILYEKSNTEIHCYSNDYHFSTKRRNIIVKVEM
jgi:hypothetical protein